MRDHTCSNAAFDRMRFSVIYLGFVGVKNDSELIGISLGLRREALAYPIDVSHRSQEARHSLFSMRKCATSQKGRKPFDRGPDLRRQTTTLDSTEIALSY